MNHIIDNKIPLLVIVGPTASGKTKLSIEIAKAFDGEIVSADSMQIYKGMDIATAKPSLAEQEGIVHHLIDFLDIEDNFSVAEYCKLAHKVILDIFSRGKLPILVGGTGLYIDSVVNNTVFSDIDKDDDIRTNLQDLADKNGVDYLLSMLKEIDIDSYVNLSQTKNLKRIIRAIEVYKLSGKTITEYNSESHNSDSLYKVIKIGLNAEDRQFIYDRINKRVDIMCDQGLLAEAKSFLNSHMSDTSKMAIGYKELAPYFNNELSLNECLNNLKMQTRRYAKRQLTWFRKDININWLYIDLLSQNEILASVIEIVKKGLFNE